MKRKLGPLPLIFPMPALLVGTYNDDRTPNAMTAAWTAICCHSPPCAGVAVRESRYTHGNLLARGAFTLNVPRATDAAEVDFLGIVSGRKEPDKLALIGFESSAGSSVDAPILEDCPINVECALIQRVAIGSHDWLIGEIKEVHVDEKVLDETGKVDIKALDPLVFCGSQRVYHRLGEQLARAFDVGKKLKR